MVGEPVFQVVVPEVFRVDVLEPAHNQSDHFGVCKTYLHILKHFFWPYIK